MTRLGTALVVLCLVALAVAASGHVAAQDSVDISLQPADGEVEAGGQTTFEVVVEGAGDGVGAHDLEIRLADSAVAEITDVETINEPSQFGTQVEVTDNGTTAVARAALGNNAYDAAPEITVLELTVEGTALNESTELTFADGAAVGPEGGGQYATGSAEGATLDVVEEVTGSSDDGSDGSGPGFGFAGALVALLGGGYLLSRTRASE